MEQEFKDKLSQDKTLQAQVLDVLKGTKLSILEEPLVFVGRPLSFLGKELEGRFSLSTLRLGNLKVSTIRFRLVFLLVLIPRLDHAYQVQLYQFRHLCMFRPSQSF